MAFGRDRSFRPGIGKFDPRSALCAQIRTAGEGDFKDILVAVGLIGVCNDGSVFVAGELTSIRLRRYAPRFG